MRLSKITSWEIQNNELVFKFQEEAAMGISFSQDDILRLRFNKGVKLLEDPDKMVVENVTACGSFRVTDEANGIKVKTDAVSLIVTFEPASIAVYTPDGRQIIKSAVSSFGEAEQDRTVLRLALTEEEKIFGLGQDPMGNINQRGHERRMWNEWGGLHVCANVAIPFYLSSEGYGLLLNNAWPSRFAVGKAKVSDPPPAHSIERSKGPWNWNQSSGEENPDDMALILENERMDVFIVMRPYSEALHGYAQLTGTTPMPPKWALGYMQSKNRYRSGEEFLRLAKEYREKQIPCDTLVLDWLWFQQFGDMEWDKDNWKEPEKMLAQLHEMGFHVMQAYHPFIYQDCLKLDTFKQKGFLMNTPADKLPIFDHSNPAAREEWWQQTLRLVKQGIDAYWIDMGEPRDHPQGTTCYLGSREHVHNLYSPFWAKGLYDGHRRDLNTRLFSLSRTSYAGIQRYGAALWSNDIDSSWEVLKDQVPAGLGVCMSGLEYWCTDIGGFSTDDRFSPELFIRWLQWGVFCPLFRTHGTRPENEPWSYGEEAQKILEEYIRLRYRLMPYIYTCAREVTEKGQPMMRALCLDYPNDDTACEQKYEFMFGPSILVAPILDKDARQREVYLPQGIWYDYWTDERIDGGRTITAIAPLNRIPLYVKEGSILPMAEVVNFIAEQPENLIQVHIYGDKPASYVLYEDDGNSYEYENGAYVKTELCFDGTQLASKVIDGDAAFIPAERRYTVVMHSAAKTEELPFHITVDSDLNTNGSCRVHLTADTKQTEVVFAYTMKVPDGWKLSDAPKYFRKTPLNKGELTLRGTVNMDWEFIPVRNALPLKAVAVLDVDVIAAEKAVHIHKDITWGSGYVTRMNVIGFFSEDDTDDAAIMQQIEFGVIVPSYQKTLRKSVTEEALHDDGELSSGGDGSADSSSSISWNRYTSFNCWGYVDLRPLSMNAMKNGRGAGYAQCRIWSDNETVCSFEFAAERSFALWINNEKIFEKTGIQPKQVPAERFTLKKGYNDCLIKCTVDYQKQMSGREIGFNFKILHEDGSDCNEFLYTL